MLNNYNNVLNQYNFNNKLDYASLNIYTYMLTIKFLNKISYNLFECIYYRYNIFKK